MKKVLIISYYWPPAGGSGVQRWLKFSKYLPNFGWEPIVYTPENPYSEIKDLDLLKDIDEAVEVWKTPIWEPYSLKDKFFGRGKKNQSAGVISNNIVLNWLRGNIFIPDPKIYWVKPSVKYLVERIRSEGIKHIITTGPPHSMHLIGLGLKKNIPNLKWIADFRDPWTRLDLLDEFYLSKLSMRKHQRLEKEVLETADITLTVSEGWVSSFKSLGSKNVELITNGFDDNDFNVKEPVPEKFIIGHFGLINHLRNPKNLWKTLDDLCDQNSKFDKKLEIRLSGNIDSDVLDNIKKHLHLKDKVKVLGYLSHKEVLEQYNNSSVLLLLLFNSESGKGNYPGKIFEYFAAKRPILAFGPRYSDAERLIQETETGVFFTYDNTELKKEILSLFNNRKTLPSSTHIEVFNRKKLTKDLSELLNSI
ncbi:MAG: glycosyl transferase family 1 [Flavobacteriales bacterium]|nr:glycosyl transferase family 1 [Flavobacteriales bacterium]